MQTKSLGVLVSYFTLFLSSIMSIIITPLMIDSMGLIEFGLYHTITSFIGVVSILDFGTSIAVTRYTSKYRISDKLGKINSFLGVAIIINSIIALFIAMFGFIMILNIDNLFSGGFDYNNIVKAKYIAILYISSIIITLFTNIFSGVLIGFEKYVLANCLILLKLISRYVIIILLLYFNYGAISITAADLLSSVLFLIISYMFVIKKTGVSPIYSVFKISFIIDVLGFSLALFLQSVVNQINNSFEKVLLGSLIGGEAVAVFSIAISIYLIYGSLSGAIKNVMLPKAVEITSKDFSTKSITNFVSETGRIQFIVLFYVLCGFILLGKDFLILWLGNGYEDAYYISLIIMIPLTLQLSQNVTETVLDAMGKRLFRSLILLVGAVLNIFISKVLILKYSVYGAALAVAANSVVFNLILLNIYHKYTIKLNVLLSFSRILSKTWLCGLISMLLIYEIGKFIIDPMSRFFILGIAYTFVYILSLFFLELSKSEKTQVSTFLNRLFSR